MPEENVTINRKEIVRRNLEIVRDKIGRIDTLLSLVLVGGAFVEYKNSGLDFASGGYSLGAISLAYSAYQNFKHKNISENALLLTSFGLTAAGVENIVRSFSDQKPNADLLVGIIDIMGAGIMFLNYLSGRDKQLKIE